MKLPLDYKNLLKDRVIILTGIGRSGTTILGSILASNLNTYYLFEPGIAKFCYDKSATFWAVLFEDYFLPLIQGRKFDTNEDDWSYTGRYWMGLTRWRPPRRLDAIQYLKDNNCKLIIKTNENFLLNDAFPVIHIIRNGNDVVQSSLNRGWYSNEYTATIIDYLNDKGSPHFLDDESVDHWDGYNLATRCACVWRTGMERLGEFYRYEDMLADPEEFSVSLCNKLGLTRTGLLYERIDEVRRHERRQYEDITHIIQEPEKAKYLYQMKRLGYAA